MEQQVPQHIQDIIEATVNRAVSTLLECGLLKEKYKKGKKYRSRSRSPSKNKKVKDKKKYRKRSSSSSSSSSSDDDDNKKEKEKGKKHHKKGLDRRSRSRSHSRGRRSRSGSRSRPHHHRRRRHHHSGSPVSHQCHYIHYPVCSQLENGAEGQCVQKCDKGRKHGRKYQCLRLYYKTGPTTSDENDDENQQKDNDSELRENFEHLDVYDPDIPPKIV